ncbi:hypothetical protein CRM22_001480 [Opisthorchis felineus]|uniref:E3 ubiquitin-protein ligase CHIP n=1 Tax=Opisthorchis felineus TaxID=147828 RepID=A0A4S2MAM0_OPIFE|nr:hypothetical protein CRM22_001480 [Opisthorchis felineus]
MNASDVCNLPHHTLKDMGNRAYAEGRYQEAVMYYTCAIKKQQNISSYYSNRALCYVQIQEYSKALSDCRRSIELDSSNLKAYFFAGQAHLGLCQWDEALNKLMHAHNLAQEQHRNFGDDITVVIRQAKRKRFEALDEKRKQEEVALQAYLNKLILRDAEYQKNTILTAHGHSVSSTTKPISTDKVPIPVDPSGSPDTAPEDYVQSASPLQLIEKAESSSFAKYDPSCLDGTHAVGTGAIVVHSSDMSPRVQARLAQVDQAAQRRMTELNELFAQVDSRRQKREVPEYLCGRISFELMLDPVITPSGITYDRRSILAHLRKVGHFDPISHQPLTENQLIPNRIMKEVVHAFLEENPWAENY